MAYTARFSPFRIDVPDADIDDLHSRLRSARWPDDLPDVGWSYGIPVALVQRLARYWCADFDWRAQEVVLNEHPQYRTEIEGRQVHFVHARSPEPDATPLLLLHGWPNTFAEFSSVIAPLIDPVAHGGRAADAFHVVVPSVPGFAFSGPTRRAGDADTARTTPVLAELMARLGYDRYGAQGGDLGSIIAPELGRIATEHVIGVHMNDPVTPSSWAERANAAEESPEDGGWAGDDAGNGDDGWDDQRFGYAAIQSTRPQTLAFGMHDSPVALLAWIADQFHQWCDPAIDDPAEAVGVDALLTTASLYWFTDTFASSTRIYKEASDWGVPRTPSGVPTGCALFPGSFVDRTTLAREHRIVHWSEWERGGHFAAMEAPEAFVTDVRTFFRELR